MKIFKFSLVLIGMLLAACSSDKNEEPAPITGDRPPTYICKTNGDYSNYVSTFTIKNGSRIAFIPNNENYSPSRKLVNDFYLDGGDAATVFVNYTCEEYRALPSLPSAEEMLRRVIPGAKVTETYKMPFYFDEFPIDELCDKCNELIEAGLPGCELVYKLEE